MATRSSGSSELQAAVMAWPSRLIPGDAVAVRYEDDPVLHERVLLWPVSTTNWYVGAPDGDQFEEDVGGFNAGPIDGYPLDNERRLPAGIEGHIYRIPKWPSDSTLRNMILNGRRQLGTRALADVDRVRLSNRAEADMMTFLAEMPRPRRRADLSTIPEGDGMDDFYWVAMEHVISDEGERVICIGDMVPTPFVVLAGATRGVARFKGLEFVVIKRSRSDPRALGSATFALEPSMVRLSS